ncbi:MAG: DUF262 domain-containing protein [Myxococcales bacterium]|nr:DUF262 domain-containing protein [Myxococcales bacterium]
MEIRGEHHPVKKVFCNDFIFRIPRYQRPYAWTQENAQELLSDLLAFMGDGGGKVADLPPYFLGSIVLAKEDHKPEADVIDGQQRLTTLTILLAVLRDLEPEYGLTEYLYQTGNRAAGTPDQYRVFLRSRDEEFFREHVQATGGLAKLAAITRSLPDAQKRIRENANLFRRELEKLTPERRQRLASYIVQRCYLVVVSTPDEDSAFRIFSVLNDRGLDLSHADILKAEIISRIDDEAAQDAYGAKWEEVEEAIGRDRFKDLFGHLRMIHRRAKLEGTVLAEFREHVVKKVADPQKLVDDVIVAGARAFDQIRRREWAGDADERTQKNIEELLDWLNRLDNVDWVPVAIRILQASADAANVLGALTSLERLAAFLLATRTTVNDRLRRYAAVLDGLDKSPSADGNAGLELSAAEKTAFVAALDGELYLEPKVRVYVLLRLDRALGDASAKYDVETVTVEHVLPQTPRDKSQWLVNFPNLTERAWTHRLGNLLLLPRRKNSEASNWDFEDKKKKYFTSKKGVSTYALTSQVLKESSWTPTVVERRHGELLKVLKELWSLDTLNRPGKAGDSRS